MATYKSSFPGVGAMLRSGFMQAEMVARAERVAAEARATAPVYEGRDSDPHRGRYKAEISVSGTSRGGYRHDRAAGVVTAGAPESIYVEFGTSRQPGHHTLLKALHAAGD